ncbi:hypothetical protein LTR56_017585 [Elasticomyces elasticus]|nr:hypothetical protein LTR56_017585 [Elasticomyces elasticus]KAK3630769.1 hypothetical protein LTR22_021348 [Elasticomyces elasticus]KAK4909183.1 hypothetical protein LTR49_022006 [Elasticomyces elasticus]KAK5749286.1 hypothetical protein LTS12_020666 [Elasticomyces elasticus]
MPSQIPSGIYLLVSTPSHIYAWDCHGITAVFTSSKAGIVAARARNSILAVADSQVVVLHDTKHGQDASWGLTANQHDELRLIEATKDGLYLTTKLANVVIRHSSSKKQTQIQSHATAPTALACSPTFVVSASDGPPITYVKALASDTTVILKPQASDAAVIKATFHPDRDHVFSLGFRDGTIAAYNAGELSRTGHDGEIGHLKTIHSGITGLAFIPGTKSRAVSVGSDGRCKLLDLESSVVIRTWHAKAPLTAVCASCNLLAVARVDGKIHLYDNLGVLQEQRTIGSERIISVEFVKGPTPPSVPVRVAENVSDPPSLPRKQTVSRAAKIPSANRAADEGTVRRNPMARSPPVQLPPDDIVDLFTQAHGKFGTPETRPTTSPRNRPRISTLTFAVPTDPRESHATSSDSEPPIPPRISRAGHSRTKARQAPLARNRANFQPVKSRREHLRGSTDTLDGTQPALPEPVVPTRHPRKGLGRQKAWHPGNVLEREVTWPADSVQEEDDGWHTDEGPQHVVESTGDSAFDTAQSHFSPESEHIRELFPRTSSLSPVRKEGTRQHQRSPWARAKTRNGESDSARISQLEGQAARLERELKEVKALLRRHGII